MGYYDSPDGIDVRGRHDAEFAEILTRDALQFVAGLQREFRGRIRYAMECRGEAKRRYNSGGLPGFDPATRFVREGDWVCAPVPPVVADRTVEITGPVERKMIINALNSGAKVFMVGNSTMYIFLGVRVAAKQVSRLHDKVHRSSINCMVPIGKLHN